MKDNPQFCNRGEFERLSIRPFRSLEKLVNTILYDRIGQLERRVFLFVTLFENRGTMQKYFLIALFFVCIALFTVQQTYSQETQPAATKELPQAVVPQVPGMPPAGLGPFRGPFRPENDPRVAAGMKEELTMQLREITRLMGQIDPRDTQFLDTLRKEQSALIEQLKGLEPATKEAGETGMAPPVLPPTTNSRPEAVEPLNPAGPELPPNWQQLTPEALAKIFAEQQNRRTAAQPGQMPPIPSRNFQSATPLGETDVPPFGSRRVPPMGDDFMPPAMGAPAALPWGGQQQPSQEIAELKETILALQKQIEQMRSEVKRLDTQMQLLNENILLKLGNSK